MRQKIVPSLGTINDVKLAQERIDMLDGFVNTLHVDIVDGTLFPNVTIQAKEVKSLKINQEFNLHLMIKLEGGQLSQYGQTKARGLIVYPKATANLERTIFSIRDLGKNVGVALDVDEEPELIKEYMNRIDFVLVLGVPSGFAGQEFHPEILQKVPKIRSYKFDISVGIDGGMHPGTVKLAAQTGVDFVVAASYIWEAENPVSAIGELDSEFSNARQRKFIHKLMQV